VGENTVEETKIDCKEACVNGCVLGDKCPNIEYRESISKFISETSLDEMHEIAEIARMKKLSAPPKWILPDDI
jgi:hypothetical protein